VALGGSSPFEEAAGIAQTGNRELMTHGVGESVRMEGMGWEGSIYIMGRYVTSDEWAVFVGYL